MKNLEKNYVPLLSWIKNPKIKKGMKHRSNIDGWLSANNSAVIEKVNTATGLNIR